MNKEERFWALVQKQPEAVKLRTTQGALFLLVVFSGMIGGALVLNFVPFFFVFVLEVLLVFGFCFWANSRENKLYDQFKQKYWATFENGN